MNYVGADLHKASTWFYVMDKSGKRIISKSISNNPEQLHTFFRQIPKPFILAVEATYNWYFFVDIAEKYAEEVFLANSYELKAFAKRHKKTDKIDARLIADVLRKGFLPAVTIADGHTRMIRELLRYRINLVKDRCRYIYRLKGLLDKLGESSAGNFLTFKRLRDIEVEHLPEEYRDIILGYTERIESFTGKIRLADRLIEKKAAGDEDTVNLMTIPGLSYFGALLIKTEIIDIRRFASFSRLCAYAGLAPRVQRSGDKSITGPLSMTRRKYLRWILVETVHHFMAKSPKRMKKYQVISKRKNYNTAKIAAARDMLKVIYHILKEKRSFYDDIKNTKIRSEAAPALQPA